MVIFTGIPLPEAHRVLGELAGCQGLLLVWFPKLLLVCQHPLGNFDTKNGQRIQVPWSTLFFIQFLLPSSCPPVKLNFLLLSTVCLRRLIGRQYPGLSNVISIYLNFWSVLLDTLHFSHARRVSTQEFWVRVSMWFMEEDGAPHQKCVAVMPQRQLLGEQKGLFLTQAVMLLLSPFSSLRSSLWPEVSLHAKFAEDNKSFHYLQGQRMDLPVPRTVKGFPPFHLSSWMQLVPRAQSPCLKHDSTSKEWLWV